MKGASHTVQLSKSQAKWEDIWKEENLSMAIPTICKELVNFWYNQK